MISFKQTLFVPWVWKQVSAHPTFHMLFIIRRSWLFLPDPVFKILGNDSERYRFSYIPTSGTSSYNWVLITNHRYWGWMHTLELDNFHMKKVAITKKKKIKGYCYRLNCIPYSPTKRYVKALTTPNTSECDLICK